MTDPVTETPATLAEVLPPPMPPRWAVLELLGHRRLVGRVSEVELFGRRMGLVEVPTRDGGFARQHFGGASVYALTETTEEKVRAELVRRWADEDRWAAHALPAHAEHPEPDDFHGDDEADDSDLSDSEMERDMADARGGTLTDDRNDEFI